LIRLNKAGIITGIQDLLFDIGLVNQQANSVAQVFLNATDLNPKAQVIVNVLKKGPTHIDIIHYTTNLPMQELSFELLQLEFNGIIKLQAGMVYSLMV
jgi:predicted Rossmann fold nucleotide-binding protein DprA/Smf involved in DNA uptake